MSVDDYHDPWLPKEYRENRIGQGPADFEMRMTAFHVAHRLFGQGFEALFPKRALTRSNLWAGGSYFPDRRKDLIAATIVGAMRGSARLEDVDPRWLCMSQSAVIAPGVQYYMEDRAYRENGISYADRDRLGNAFPLVYQRAGMGERVILAGHHRAAAALALGLPLKALVVRDDDESILAHSPRTDSGPVISELLHVGHGPKSAVGTNGSVDCGTARQASMAIRSNGVAVVPSTDVARETLILNGSDEDWAAHITTGRGIRRTATTATLSRSEWGAR